MDPGLFGPDSTVWRIARERVLLAGGPAALLLQISHPLVAAGVAAHSDFVRDPLQRLRATLDATLRVSFGDTEQARVAASAVHATHRRVRGLLETSVGAFTAGTAYDATDPELALWVHATLVWSALATYHALVRPLPTAERAAYYEEAKAFALLFGVGDGHLPPTFEHFRSYFREMVDSDRIAVGEGARTLARHVLTPPLPNLLRPAGAAERIVTAALLPSRLRDEFGLPWGGRERLIFRALSASTRSVVRALPANVRYWPHYRAALGRMRGVTV